MWITRTGPLGSTIYPYKCWTKEKNFPLILMVEGFIVCVLLLFLFTWCIDRLLSALASAQMSSSLLFRSLLPGFYFFLSWCYAHTSMLNWHVSQKMIRRRNIQIHFITIAVSAMPDQNKFLQTKDIYWYVLHTTETPNVDELNSIFCFWHLILVLYVCLCFVWFGLVLIFILKMPHKQWCMSYFLAWHFIYAKNGTHNCGINVVYIQTYTCHTLYMSSLYKDAHEWYYNDMDKYTYMRQKLFNLTNKMRLGTAWAQNDKNCGLQRIVLSVQKISPTNQALATAKHTTAAPESTAAAMTTTAICFRLLL